MPKDMASESWKKFIYDVRRGVDIYRDINWQRLKSWILAGKIKREESIVWRSGLSGWRRPEDLYELAPYFKLHEKNDQEIQRKKEKTELIYRGKKYINNILIVDDEEDLCLLLSDALKLRGYNVAVANTRRSGLANVKNEKPDLVLLDLNLPDGDGMRLLPKIRKLSPETAVFIISVHESEERKGTVKKRGAFAFIEKPFTDKDILREISKLNQDTGIY